MMPRAFRAKTMPAALAAVEKALGNEALIVSIHPIPAGPAWQVWRRSGVEVVAMPSAMESLYADSEPPEAEQNPVRPVGGGIPPPPAASDPTGGANPASAAPAAGAPLPPALAHLDKRLRAQGVASDWIARVVKSVKENPDARILGDETLTREFVRQQILRGLRSDCGACLMHRKIIFLVGSNGCGKTSACAKIASYAIKSLGKRVHWISSDATRAGAIAKAQAFTAPLGIPLQLAYRPEELPSLLHRDSDSDLFLVDTPGSNPYRPEEIRFLDACIADIPDRHILWVVPATAKESDLQDMYTAFSHMGIGGAVVTRLDETRSFGGLYNVLNRSRLPLAFLSHGPRIHGDLHTGEISILASLLLGEKTF